MIRYQPFFVNIAKGFANKKTGSCSKPCYFQEGIRQGAVLVGCQMRILLLIVFVSLHIMQLPLTQECQKYTDRKGNHRYFIEMGLIKNG